MHQVGSNEPCEGERTCNDLVGIVSQTQQQEGNECGGDLNPHGVFGGPDKVVDFQRLLDPSKEQFDGPSSLVQISDFLRACPEIIGQDAQHLAGLDDDPDLADET